MRQPPRRSQASRTHDENGTPLPSVSTAAADGATASRPRLGVYVHIPFCERTCPYCDFNTYAGLADQWSAYVDALCREIHAWSVALGGSRVSSVFVGGGTPTVLPAASLRQITGALTSSFAVADAAEVTCEANPGTVDRTRFQSLRQLGVTRLSMGVQSFDDEELAFLGRIHSADEAVDAFSAGRSAGFDNISLDLMFGLPGQSIDVWGRTLHRALSLSPEHVSLYHLAVEPGTPLARSVSSGQVAPPDNDRAAEQYELAMHVLAAAGYVHYEVSNWARASTPASDVAGSAGVATSGDEGPSRAFGRTMPTLACQHNLVYWRNEEYVGAGAGAHGHLSPAASRARCDPDALEAMGLAAARSGTRSQRWWNLRPVGAYIDSAGSGEPAIDGQEEIDATKSMGETMMLGLRLLTEGVAHRRFENMHGRDPRDVYLPEIEELTDLGLLDVDDERSRLTRTGLLLGNQVFERFLAAD